MQRILEDRGLPYTGSGPEASALCMDKWAARQCLARQGVRVADGVLVRASDKPETVLRQAAPLGWPVIVKPRHGGSSVGVSLVREASGMAAALAAAERTEPEAVLERFIPGREITMGILGDRVLPPLELVVGREFYDYGRNAGPSTVRWILLPGGRRWPRDAALRSFGPKAGGWPRGLRRRPGSRGLEVNTSPGSRTATTPMAAAAAESVSTSLLPDPGGRPRGVRNDDDEEDPPVDVGPDRLRGRPGRVARDAQASVSAAVAVVALVLGLCG